MNPHLKNLKKLEFVVTYACTGKCKHCSEGDHAVCGEHIDPDVAADAVRKIAGEYPIQTVMTFGGEPLLYPDVVCKIHDTARKMGIEKRQIITNGYFSRDVFRIREVAEKLVSSGVNDVLLSVDAFHQEMIPLEIVKTFAVAVKEKGIPIRLQPAWLVSITDNNPYNVKTREILGCFRELGIGENEGNVIFPEGNAKKYLGEYFISECPENPYCEDPFDVRCISIDPNGDTLGGNIYRQDILGLLRDYTPKKV
jgi:uncharacterized Fe-S cluster-containing radical SAM superfamily enzyme